MGEEPSFKFWFKIRPKKRGNFRPKAEIGLEIKGADFPHRPRLRQVYLLFKREDGNYPLPPNAKIGEYYAEGDWRGYDGVVMPAPLYRGERKGDDSYTNTTSHNYKYADGREGEFSYGYDSFQSGMYVESEKEKRRETAEFYLEFRPGAKPDYSDYVAAFKKVGEVIREMLKDGLDSGVNDEVVHEEEYRALSSGEMLSKSALAAKPAQKEDEKKPIRKITLAGGQ